MKKLELKLTLILIITINVLSQGQEICNNGIDDDGDGLIDCRDCADCASACTVYDWDNDGINNYCDLDDDNDGIPDEYECPNVSYGAELIQNGNFENGYAHWTSDFNRGKNNFAATAGGCGAQGWVALSSCASRNGLCNNYYDYNGGTPNGQTVITDNLGTGANILSTTNCNSTSSSCLAQLLPDHTTGTGLSLYVDPNDIPGKSYWKQSVTIQPNKYYEFSAWIMVIEEDPELIFRINNTNLTDIFNLDRQTGGNNSTDIWQPVMTTWFSGSNAGNVTIELVNIVAGCSGNDLRLDDISFREIINFCDADGDGIANIYDLDSDNDGITDLNEAGHNAPDNNNDGIIDGSNANFGSNGLFNNIETAPNSDIINFTVKNSENTPDAIFDAYELDSDGDGCLDTKEENIPDNDEDGLAGTGTPTITTKGLVSTHTYTAPTINEWQSPLANVNCVEDCTNGIDDDGDGLMDCDDPDCTMATSGTQLDTDNDGVIDFCDDDDDNDGILDLNENICGFFDGISGTANPSATTVSSTLITNSGQSFIWTSSNNHAIRVNSSNNDGEIAYIPCQDDPTSTSKVFNVTVTFPTPTTVFEIFAFDYDGPNSETIEDFNIMPTHVSDNAILSTTGTGKVTGDSDGQDITVSWSLPTPISTLTFKVTRPSCSLGISFQVGFPYCDTDGDGIVDSKDEDSDGDGCYDIVESGGIDSDNDGKLDGTGVNADGLVTGGVGGYDGTNGSEIVGTQISITTPPSDQTKNTGEATTISLVVQSDKATDYSSGIPLYGTPNNDISSLTYQWYLGNPNTTGTPIIDGSIYNGATTETLNISDVTGLNGTQYCVVVTNSNNTCIEEIRCMILSVNIIEICDDGQDNDGDGLIDCADPDCSPVIADVVPTQLNCPLGTTNGQIIITATGPGTLTYSITNEPNYQASNTFLNLSQGIYTVRVQSSTGCMKTYDAAVIQLNTPNCPEICNDGVDNDGDGLIDCDDSDCGVEATNNIVTGNN